MVVQVRGDTHCGDCPCGQTMSWTAETKQGFPQELKRWAFVSPTRKCYQETANQLWKRGFPKSLYKPSRIQYQFIVHIFKNCSSLLILLLFSRSVMSDALRPRNCSKPSFSVLLHLPELAQTPCPSSRWCHTTISRCRPASSCLQPSRASGFILMNRLFTPGGPSIGTSASASVLPMNIQNWFPLGWTGLISLQSKGLPRFLHHHCTKASILWHSAFFMVQLSHPHRTTGKTIALTIQTFVGSYVSAF